jgi:hypothetical protein
MIERDDFDEDIFNVNCDFCSNTDEFNSEGDWSDLMSQMKETGWKSRKNRK